MPKNTKKTKSKKTANKTNKFNRYLSDSLYLLVICGIVLICVLIGYIVWHQHREVGQYNISDIYVGEKSFSSLDLRVAAKSSYPSSAITVMQDLGEISGLREKVFSYDVKNDGLVEHGLMIMPPGPEPAKGYPAIVLLHGYINSKRYMTSAGYIQDMIFYAKHGFLVLKPDLRGQGDSAAAGHSDSAYYSMSYNTDTLSLISALKKTNYVDKTNISLWGHSMGAYIALRAAVLSPDIKNIILLSGPVDSLREMYLTYIAPSDEDNPYALATRNDVFSKYGTPADGGPFWYEASPINMVQRIKAKVQIHIGQDDEVVAPVFSADLDAAMTKAHISHQYFVYPGGNHGLQAERPQIYGASLQLLEPSIDSPSA